MKRGTLISLLSLAAVGVIATSISVSYALYERSTTLTGFTITGAGRKDNRIYLDPGVWGADGSGDDIYMVAWKNDNLSQFTWEKGTTKGTITGQKDVTTYFVFNFDPALYDRLSFHRISTERTPNALDDKNQTDSGGMSDNSTSTLTLNVSSNYYTITSWNTTGSYGFLSGGTWGNSHISPVIS